MQQQLRRAAWQTLPYAVLHQLQSKVLEVPLLSPLPLLLFGVFQLWKDLLQCFETRLEIRKGLGFVIVGG